MSLIQCKECNHEISNDAWFCPQCGYPHVKDSRTLKRGIIYAGVILWAVLILNWIGFALS